MLKEQPKDWREQHLKKTRYLIFPLAALAALLLAGCGATNTAGGPPAVETAVVARGQLSSNAQVSGKLAAVRSADLFTLSAGRVVTVNVDVGSKVTAGQVLLTLDSSTQAAAVAQARAAVNQAQAAVAQAQAAEQADQVAYDIAKANYVRGQALLAEGAIPQGGQNGFDNAFKLPYQQADVKLHQVDPATLRAAQAQLQVAQAQLQSAQAAYNLTVLTAPFDGVITARNVNPGDMSAGPPAIPGETPLLVEVQLDPIYAAVNVGEDQVNGLAVGQHAQVHVSGVSDESLTGTISHIAAAANPDNKTFLVEVTLRNPYGTLKPGMFCSVTFNENNAGYLLVPNQAIVHEGSDTSVWVVGKDQTVEKRSIQTGATDGQNTIVDEGLRSGDVVVTSGWQGLTAGEKVAIQKS